MHPLMCASRNIPGRAIDAIDATDAIDAIGAIDAIHAIDARPMLPQPILFHLNQHPSIELFSLFSFLEFGHNTM